MSIYLLGLLFGAGGLLAMAFTGLGRHGGGARAGHAALGSGGRANHAVQTPGANHVGSSVGSRLMALASPRFIFSVSLGFGVTGLALGPIFRHVPLIGSAATGAAAILGGVLIDRFVFSPIWNLSFRFASEPAATLDTCVADEATAVTSFNAQGQGIVAIDLDGQVVQILGTLEAADRELGVRVRAGERVRIETVDAARNRCTVSLV